MEFEFYNVEPSGGLMSRMLRPFRRLLRRIQRPYFQRLRDLLQTLYGQQTAQAQRQNDFATQLKTVEDHYMARIEQLEKTIAHLHGVVGTVQNEKAFFQTDYLAVTRRLARLEDLLIEVLVNTPVVPEQHPGPSLAKIAS